MRARRWLRVGVAILIVLAVFAAARWLPLPTAGDAARADVLEEVSRRLPGWRVARATQSWEGAWTVVLRCAGHQIDFQYVTGHGLGPGDAWLQPISELSWSRLWPLSDHGRYLIWFGDPTWTPRHSCEEEIARQGIATSRDRERD
jgi:hypothetical protein